MEDLERKRKVLKALRDWREKAATREGVELYRIISNDAVNGIADTLPTTKEALLDVKGIAEKKWQKYGRDILAIVAGETNTGLFENDESVKSVKSIKTVESDDEGLEDGYRQTGEKIFTVSDYLELLNVGLREFEAKVVGEIMSLDIRGNYLFFSVKDKKEDASMSVFMWSSNYRLSGVELLIGLEVAVSGFPKIHKQSGRISFEAQGVELVGEGALKKAYDELKKKLEKEGIFSEARKKELPEYPQKIGLITSSTGAVIHDFLNNIGKYGFKIFFKDSRVEGALAVKELVSAVKYFKKQKGIDILVLIRGGGSLESLAAFNNETLTREIADCPFPVVVGIGHDKDVPLVSLAADRAPSTPTAVAKLLNSSWEQALAKVRVSEQKILRVYGEALHAKKSVLWRISDSLLSGFRRLTERFHFVEEKLKRNFQAIGFSIQKKRDGVLRAQKNIPEKFALILRRQKESLVSAWKLLEANNPERQLSLGYSLAFSKGKILRSAKDIAIGDKIEIKLQDGTINAKAE